MQSNPVPTHTLTLTGRSTATLTGVGYRIIELESENAAGGGA